MSDEFVIRPLAPDLLDAYLDFFDHDAFADNPLWASCYCYFNHCPHDREDWDARTGKQNRADASRLIADGQMHGHLAFANGRVVGWCNAGPAGNMTALPDAASASADTGAVVCFVIAKPYRGQGIATRLLEAACEGFRSQGLAAVEAYPRKEATTEAANYHGPLPMYLAAGFEIVDEDERVFVVRKRLKAADSGESQDGEAGS